MTNAWTMVKLIKKLDELGIERPMNDTMEEGFLLRRQTDRHDGRMVLAAQTLGPRVHTHQAARQGRQKSTIATVVPNGLTRARMCACASACVRACAPVRAHE
jgi:hypothetical protein